MDRISRFIEDLHSPKSSKRYEACEWLRVAPDLTEAAREALEQVTHDADPEVAGAARHALEVHMPSSTYVTAAALAAPSAPYPLSKGALWAVGILIYVFGSAYLIVFGLGSEPIFSHIRGLLGDWVAVGAVPGFWVAVLALSAWLAFARGHRTVAVVMALITALAAVLSCLFWFAAGMIA